MWRDPKIVQSWRVLAKQTGFPVRFVLKNRFFPETRQVSFNEGSGVA